MLFVGQGAVYLFSFFYAILTARYLGVQGYGTLSFALAFTGMFSVFADFGLSTLMIREVAREKNLTKKYLGNITIIKTILVLITYISIVVIINLLDYPKQTVEIVYLFAIYINISSFVTLFNSLFQAFEKMEYQSLGQIINSGLLLLGSLLIIHFGLGITGYGFLYIIVSLIILFYSAFLCVTKFTIPRFEVDWHFWKRLIKDAWPMGGMSILTLIYFRIDVIMLSLIVGEAAVGLYSAAYQLSEMTTIIPIMYITAMFPLMSRFYKKSNSSFKKTYAISVKYLTFSAIFVALIITVLAGPIINLIYGNAFTESVLALQIIIWSAAIMYITMLQGNAIITANKQSFSFKITLITAIFNILINLILIPKYSFYGASFATVLTEAFGFIMGVIFLNRWGYKINLKETFLPPFLALFGAIVITLILLMLNVNIIIITITTALIYIIIIYKSGIKTNDKVLIRDIIKSVTGDSFGNFKL